MNTNIYINMHGATIKIIQCLVHKSPPLLRIVSQINRVHGPPTDFGRFIIRKIALILLANTLSTRADEQSMKVSSSLLLVTANMFCTITVQYYRMSVWQQSMTAVRVFYFAKNLQPINLYLIKNFGRQSSCLDATKKKTQALKFPRT
jgi:hypothetical protein